MDPEAEVRERGWKKLALQVDKLTLVQRSKLHGALERHGAEAQVVALIDRAGEAAPTCPHCRASRVVRNGQANGLQRYKRSACAHTFNALTGTPMARLRHKGKWLAQAQVLSPGAEPRAEHPRGGEHTRCGAQHGVPLAPPLPGSGPGRQGREPDRRGHFLLGQLLGLVQSARPVRVNEH